MKTPKSKETFETLFNAHWHHLYTFAYNILKNKQAAEDCVQNVYVDFWNRFESAEILHPKAYLYQAVKYQCAKVLVKQKRFNYSIDIEKSVTTPNPLPQEVTVQENKILQEVHEKIDLLPTKCQQVFRYSKIENKSNKQIALEMGISVRTVENHINKAFKILRNTLPDHLYIFMLLWF